MAEEEFAGAFYACVRYGGFGNPVIMKDGGEKWHVFCIEIRISKKNMLF